MAIENERRWLVAEMPDLTSVPHEEHEQFYLVPGSNIRVRAVDDALFELTKKLKTEDGVTGKADEKNVDLTEAEFTHLRAKADRGIMKTRYKIALDSGHVADLDVYRGALERFAKIEVEFVSDEDRATFVPPPWFGRDVTEEGWASNSALAGKTYADVEPFILHGPTGKPASN